MNKPVAWMWYQSKENTNPYTQMTGYSQLCFSEFEPDCNVVMVDEGTLIPLYTQEQLEEARKLGMQQERALWNLSESTQEFESFDRTASHMAGEYVAHPVKELTLTKEEIHAVWANGEYYTLDKDGSIDEFHFADFARAILRKAQEK